MRFLIIFARFTRTFLTNSFFLSPSYVLFRLKYEITGSIHGACGPRRDSRVIKRGEKRYWNRNWNRFRNHVLMVCITLQLLSVTLF